MDGERKVELGGDEVDTHEERVRKLSRSSAIETVIRHSLTETSFSILLQCMP